MKPAIRLLLPLLALLAGCGSPVTEQEAELLARERLAEYAEEEGLKTAAFGKPAFSSDPRHPYVFDFDSVTVPRHFVRIYVNEDGDTELNRLVDDPPEPAPAAPLRR